MADLSTHVEYPTAEDVAAGSNGIALTGELTWHKLAEMYELEDGEVLVTPSSKDKHLEYDGLPHMRPSVLRSSQKLPEHLQYVVVFGIDSQTRIAHMHYRPTSVSRKTARVSAYNLLFPVENEKCFLLYDQRRRIIYIGPQSSMRAFSVGAHPEESMFSEDFGQEPTDALLQYGFEDGHLPVITKDALGEALYKAALLQLHPIELYLPF